MSSSLSMSFLVFLATVAYISYGQELKWVQLSSKECWPSARIGHSSIAFAHQLWVFGGGTSISPLNNLWRYDIEGRSWTQLPNSGSWPRVRGWHSAVVDAARGELFVFGGRDLTSGGDYLSDLWKFDVKELIWTQLQPASGSWPQVRYQHSAILDAFGDMWLFAGWSPYDPVQLKDLWQCALEGPNCTQLSESGTWPTARKAHTAVVDASNSMWVFGGIEASHSHLGDLWKFDINSRTWAQIPQGGPAWPAVREQHTMVITDTQLLLFGGRSSTQSEMNDLWTFDVKAQSWEELRPSGSWADARFAHVASLDGLGRLWIFAGTSFSWTTAPKSDLWLIEVQQKPPEAELVASVMPAFMGIHTISALILAWLWYRWQPGADPPSQHGVAQAPAATMGRQRMMDSE